MSKDKLLCSHCSSECPDNSINIDDKYFCCTGCKTVYEILHDNDLESFYKYGENAPVLKPEEFDESEFAYLDDEEIKSKLKTYSIGEKSKVSFLLPQIHCSACIWLLENLHKLKKGITESKVNFLEKEVEIVYQDNIISLRELVELLASLGYKPKIDLSTLENKKRKDPNRPLYIKLGIAFFSFGNLMMLAFPEYLSAGDFEADIREFIKYLNLLFIPPLLYAGSDYLKSAYYGYKTRVFNIDIPLSVGILALAGRSAFDILSGLGAGYVDTLGGLIFFLLIGKFFQQKTYSALSFNRDYRSYFPLSVIRVDEDNESHIQIKNIKIGDELKIRNNEIIPCDSILESETASIDYSFVTGESIPVRIKHKEKIFAGGKLIGKNINVRVIKEFNQGYLTRLWNEIGEKSDEESYISRLSSVTAKYFSIVVLTVAIVSFFTWLSMGEANKGFDAFTAILIIACPCALAMTLPFTYGTAMRILGRHNFYLKSDKIIETMAKIKSIVFDKTGTITKSDTGNAEYSGNNIDKYLPMIKATVSNSIHPISKAISNKYSQVEEKIDLEEFQEIPGSGIVAVYKDYKIRIGSKAWLDPNNKLNIEKESSSLLEINGELLGYYYVTSVFRNNIFSMLKELKSQGYETSILSGDTEKDKEIIDSNIEIESNYGFLPHKKFEYIENKKKKNPVAMIGDGLNDSGAISNADLGIAVAEESNSFTPGSDAIILAENLNKFPKFMNFSKSAIKVAYISIGISFMYNIVGLSFAAQALLSPVLAAILMPASSISVILFTVIMTTIMSKKNKL